MDDAMSCCRFSYSEREICISPDLITNTLFLPVSVCVCVYDVDPLCVDIKGIYIPRYVSSSRYELLFVHRFYM